MDILRNIIYEEVRRAINEIYKAPKNDVLELGDTAVSKKRKYARALWDLIQRNYQYIGGCKSFDSIKGDDGFTDFVNGKYIWRIFLGNDSSEILGIIVYKPTKWGRKRVCSAAVNGDVYRKLIEKEFDKSNHVYGEVSGKSEHMLNKDKRTNWVNKNKVQDILNKDISLERDSEVDKLEKIPYDDNRHYYRQLGGEKHRKAMFGNPINNKKL